MPSQTCPYCREALDPENGTECPECRTPHHLDCWQENGGCTVFGCRCAPTDDPKIAVTSGDIVTNGTAVAYYVERNGASDGPFTLAQLREETYRGTLRGESLAWREGLQNWVPLSTFLGLGEPPPISVRAPVHVAPRFVATPAAPVDPCEGRLHFGRTYYFLSVVAMFFVLGALSTSEEAAPAVALLFWCVWIPVAVLRVRDVGMSGWMVLLGFLPIANLWLGFNLLVAPRGYAITKQGDTFFRVMCWVLIGTLILGFIILLIAAATN